MKSWTIYLTIILTSCAIGQQEVKYSEMSSGPKVTWDKGELIVRTENSKENSALLIYKIQPTVDPTYKVITFYKSVLPTRIEYVEQTEDSIRLGEKYLIEGVVGKTSRTDCRHIALATLINADILVSWNFKHIVNITRIRGYNSVNVKNGHRTLEIRTPREILES